MSGVKRAFDVVVVVVSAPFSLLVMLLVALYSGLVVLREVSAIQQEVGGLSSSLPANDARRARFDELHQLSTHLMMANILGALVLLYWEAREQ